MSYRVPREPSTPRIAVWRSLKRLGVAQLGDGLVALPYDAVTKESLEWVASSVLESGGEATIWKATPAIRRWGRDLADRMSSERAEEYQEIVARAAELDEQADVSTRSLSALRAELRRIERRDHFPPPDKAEARRAVDELAESSAEAMNS